MLLPLRWIFGLLLGAFVHEMGHLIAIWAWGGKLHGIEISATGARILTGPMEDREELFCALAGPLAGALVCLFWRWVPVAAICAGIQTVFNLLPIYPLDGGRALRAAGRMMALH